MHPQQDIFDFNTFTIEPGPGAPNNGNEILEEGINVEVANLQKQILRRICEGRWIDYAQLSAWTVDITLPDSWNALGLTGTGDDRLQLTSYTADILKRVSCLPDFSGLAKLSDTFSAGSRVVHALWLQDKCGGW